MVTPFGLFPKGLYGQKHDDGGETRRDASTDGRGVPFFFQ